MSKLREYHLISIRTAFPKSYYIVEVERRPRDCCRELKRQPIELSFYGRERTWDYLEENREVEPFLVDWLYELWKKETG